MTGAQRWLALLAVILTTLVAAFPVQAHPAPYSYLDLTMQPTTIDGTLTVHAIDLAHELAIDQPATLLDRGELNAQFGAVQRLLSARMRIGAGDLPPPRWMGITPMPGDNAVRLSFQIDAPPPPALALDAALFPYDPAHQTFVNIYDHGELAQQWILTPGDTARTWYAGTTAGGWAVLQTFVPAGFEHILIGPDHVLFVIGLLLLGGTWRRLALIVTAFTLGHSLTLSLAALDMVQVHPAIIEPLIALTIVVVGVDNLLRLRESKAGRDLRAGMAAVFGLIHGFGFAYVLQQFGLPQGQLAVSLIGFNLGVELGQLAIVIPVAALLGWLAIRRPAAARHMATIGSLAVALAGAYWFVDRVIQGAGS